MGRPFESTVMALLSQKPICFVTPNGSNSMFIDFKRSAEPVNQPIYSLLPIHQYIIRYEDFLMDLTFN
jgi:hypothetical protein